MALRLFALLLLFLTMPSPSLAQDASAQKPIGEQGAIVCLGDSTTAGVGASASTNRWTDLLGRRLQAAPATAHLSVVNAGIAGNRLLHDNVGPSALSRLEHDALAIKDVRWLILLEGINDIGFARLPNAVPADTVSTEQIIAAYREIIAKAHARGIKVIGGTILPFAGSMFFSAKGEEQRQALNAFIRTGGEFDAVIDFEAAMRDPAKPEALFDSGDHLHPSDAGYKAMSEAVDLGLFR